MEYRRVKYFLKAAETKNFTKAAAELFVSHQALIRQIALLEEELGVKLFERTTRSVRLTEVGEEAYHRFRHIDSQLEKAVLDLERMGHDLAGKVRFGIFSAVSKELVSFLMDEIQAAFPGLVVEPVMRDYVETHLSMLEGRTDLCLTNAHEEENWDGFEKIPFLTMQAKVAVSLYHPWAAKEELTVSDMEQEIFVKLDVDRAVSDYNEMQRKNRKKLLHYTARSNEAFFDNIPCRECIPVPNFESLLATMERGKGFAVIPDEFIQKQYFKMKFFPLPYRDFEFQTAFIYPKKTKNAAIPNVVKLVKSLEFEKKEP